MDKILYFFTAIITIFTAGYFKGKQNETKRKQNEIIENIKRTSKLKKDTKKLSDIELNNAYNDLLQNNENK